MKAETKIIGLLGLAVLTVPLAVCAQQMSQPSSVDAAAATITEADYLRRVGVIAHDTMQGRDTPSAGLDRAAAWIASEFARMGLRGGAEDGGFIQRYPLPLLPLDRERSGLIGGARALEYGKDIVPLSSAAEGGESRGGLVLVSGSQGVGRGLDASAVRGRHAVLVLGEMVQSIDGRAAQLASAIRDAGAASVLVMMTIDDTAWTDNSLYALRPVAPRDSVGRAESPFRPLLLVRTASVEDLVRGRGVDVAALQDRWTEAVRIDPVEGLDLTLTQRLTEDSATAPNVVAILPGSDPSLRGQYVVFSAHMDGHGLTSPDASGDSILNGADDDASGTVAVIEIAEAMASLATKPRRSMLFLLVSGEEKGLWGSEHYAANPTVPIDSMVANLNTDMVGRNWPDTIVAIGKEHSDLGQTLERVNAAHPELGMTAIDDIWPEQRFYERSDHYNFAQRGVPILFFFNGTHEDYHGRDDEVERIDGEKAARIARLVFYLGMEIGNAEERPRWDPDSYARIVSDRSP
jgi:hypothetical protein